MGSLGKIANLDNIELGRSACIVHAEEVHGFVGLISCVGFVRLFNEYQEIVRPKILQLF